MSEIIITCKKGFVVKQTSYDKKDEKQDHELNIQANQWFMDTEKFFLSVKESLKEYFDTIDKK
jgi:hypothetical protein